MFPLDGYAEMEVQYTTYRYIKKPLENITNVPGQNFERFPIPTYTSSTIIRKKNRAILSDSYLGTVLLP